MENNTEGAKKEVSNTGDLFQDDYVIELKHEIPGFGKKITLKMPTFRTRNDLLKRSGISFDELKDFSDPKKIGKMRANYDLVLAACVVLGGMTDEQLDLVSPEDEQHILNECGIFFEKKKVLTS